jgi:Protein of unknown function (DUF3300)
MEVWYKWLMKTTHLSVWAALLLAAVGWQPLAAQSAPRFSSSELERLVSRIALYPDPLLAQVLAAATYYDQIPDAAKWSDAHHYLTGEALAAAITEDNVPWEPCVQALLPFSYVLEHMAGDMEWTTQLGNAYLAHTWEVMEAVQRMRRIANDYAYLVRNKQVLITPLPAYVMIMPANPDLMPVPIYSTGVVFLAPAAGASFSTSAISYRLIEHLGPAFAPWGWATTRIAWDRRAVIVNNAPWTRGWGSRAGYAHPYPDVHRDSKVRAQEKHELVPRTASEKASWEDGRQRAEEHSDRATDKKPEHPN